MTIVEKQTTEPAPGMSPVRRRSMPQIVGGGVLVLIGALWLLERTGVIDVSVTAVLALATMVTGVALMMLSTEGSHGGLVVFGTILALIALLTAAAPFEGFQGGIGDREIEVSSVDEIRPDYNLAMGKLVLDLSEMDIEAGTRLTASVGMGELIIRIPEGTEASVEARVGAGQLEVLGRITDGIGVDETFTTPGSGPGSPSLSLDLQVFAGRVEVTDE